MYPPLHLGRFCVRWRCFAGRMGFMIAGIAFLLAFQLTGEVVVRSAGLPLPGPVLGLAFLLLGLRVGGIAEAVEPVARALLGNLSLLFVPAGVGVVGHLGLLATDGVAILLAILVSTVAALLTTVGVFVAVSRVCGGKR